MSFSPTETYVSPQSGEFPPCSNPEELHDHFIKATENTLHVGEAPLLVHERGDDPIGRVAMRESAGIFMNYHPQVMEISAETQQVLEGAMAEWYGHYPYEPTYAQEHFGVPMLLTRFDGTISPTGELGLCEFDDVPTGFNALGDINPTARSYVDGMVAALDEPLHSVQLDEEGYVYPHDDDAWLPSLQASSSPSAPVIPRARRTAPGFDAFLDEYGPRSVVAAWQRDHKGPLIAMGLGALAANLDTVLELAEGVKAEHPLFMKGLRSSRTEAAAVIASNKWRIKGNSSPGQVRRKFEAAGIAADEDFPIVVQPFHRPPTMAELGLTFHEKDSSTLAAYQQDARNSNGSELAQPGNEDKYHVLSRIYGVYAPGMGHKIVGGFWMARPNAAIIHGSSDALVGTLNVAGLESYTA